MAVHAPRWAWDKGTLPNASPGQYPMYSWICLEGEVLISNLHSVGIEWSRNGSLELAKSKLHLPTLNDNKWATQHIPYTPCREKSWNHVEIVNRACENLQMFSFCSHPVIWLAHTVHFEPFLWIRFSVIPHIEMTFLAMVYIRISELAVLIWCTDYQFIYYQRESGHSKSSIHCARILDAQLHVWCERTHKVCKWLLAAAIRVCENRLTRKCSLRLPLFLLLQISRKPTKQKESWQCSQTLILCPLLARGEGVE